MAMRQGLVSVNPCLAIESIRDREIHKGVFTPEQVSALIEAATSEWAGLIPLAFYTGARLGDCASLRWKHIDLVSEIATIRIKQGKTGRGIVIAVHPLLEDYLLRLPAPKTDEAFLFPTLAQQAQRHVGLLSRAFREIMRAARIEESVIRERGEAGRKVYSLSFHSLRHSFSSILANAGIPEELRMALTGHTTRSVHQHYTHHELARLRDAVSVLPKLRLSGNNM